MLYFKYNIQLQNLVFKTTINATKGPAVDLCLSLLFSILTLRLTSCVKHLVLEDIRSYIKNIPCLACEQALLLDNVR